MIFTFHRLELSFRSYSSSAMTINDAKLDLGFDDTKPAVYTKWRKSVKAYMTTNTITGRRGTSNEVWEGLENYAMSLMPVKGVAHLIRQNTVTGKSLLKKLNELLQDCAKKEKESARELDASEDIEAIQGNRPALSSS